jgi:hypothetical protein
VTVLLLMAQNLIFNTCARLGFSFRCHYPPGSSNTIAGEFEKKLPMMAPMSNVPDIPGIKGLLARAISY